MHISGLPELAHRRIDNRIASLPPLPTAQRFVILFPRKFIKTWLQILPWQTGEMIEQHMRKFAPAKL